MGSWHRQLLFSVIPQAQYWLLSLCSRFEARQLSCVFSGDLIFVFCDRGHTLQSSLTLAFCGTLGCVLPDESPNACIDCKPLPESLWPRLVSDGSREGTGYACARFIASPEAPWRVLDVAARSPNCAYHTEDLRLMAVTETTDHQYFLKLQQRKQWLRWGKGKKGHALLSIIFKESSVLFKT